MGLGHVLFAEPSVGVGDGVCGGVCCLVRPESLSRPCIRSYPNHNPGWGRVPQRK